MKVTSTEYDDLLGRAQAINSDAVAEFAKMASEGQTASQISRRLLDLAIAKRGPVKLYGSFSDIPDDVLVQSISDPTTFTP